jgi:hypothetical protein
MVKEWYRFPIDVIDSDTNRTVSIVRTRCSNWTEYYESWVDVRLDSIVQSKTVCSKR